METQGQTWEMVKKLLREARDLLALEMSDQEPFHDFLDHNELELAWEVLEEVAGRTNATVGCWRKLAQAARLMQLPANEAAAFRRGNLPADWDIRREGRQWTKEESGRRIHQAPEKIEFVGGIFANDRERLTVLGMLMETLGIDRVIQFGKLSDWKAAIADLERDEGHVQ
jgi:hypothetical protein